jgi:hypothetical protein
LNTSRRGFKFSENIVSKIVIDSLTKELFSSIRALLITEIITLGRNVNY